MIVRITSKEPEKLADRFADGQVVYAGNSPGHETVFIGILSEYSGTRNIGKNRTPSSKFRGAIFVRPHQFLIATCLEFESLGRIP
jgi:hypothetical protein